MSLLDKSIQNYIFKIPNLRNEIWDEKGNQLGEFTGGFTNKLLDSDKSVILKFKLVGLKANAFGNKKTVFDSSGNLLGTIMTEEGTDKSLVVSVLDKNGNKILNGRIYNKKNVPYNIVDNQANVIAQLTKTNHVLRTIWNLHIVELSYDRAFLLCFFWILIYG